MSQPPPSLTRVHTVRAQEQIVDQLQEFILGGQYPPGSHLPSERTMMGTFGVSRPTVREALRVAESMGLIAVRHGDPAGPRVLARPDVGITRVFDGLLRHARASRLELLQLRVILDSAGAALACSRPEEALRPAAEALERMPAAPDLEAFAALDSSFHRGILEAGGNGLFTLVHDALEEPIQRLITRSLDTDFERKRLETVRQHADILDRIRRGDARGTAAAVRHHFRHTYGPGLEPAERQDLERLLESTGRAD